MTTDYIRSLGLKAGMWIEPEIIGAQYIKMDYNEDVGVTDESLTVDRAAYLDLIDNMRARFPDVLFETCSSGGMRMDYRTLQHFSIVSTSDQTNYRLYLYISANGACTLQAI